MVIVGFDWARDKHDVCVQNEKGEVLFIRTVRHAVEALNEITALTDEIEPDRERVHVALEQHDGALLAWLLSTGYTVYGINPKSTERARDIYRPAGGKDDRIDAQTIADLLRGNLVRFKPMHSQSDETLHLRSLARLRMRLMTQKTALMQRLRTIIAEWCPDVSHLCGDFNRKWQRDLLERWPLHEDLVEAHGNALNGFMASHRLSAATREKLTGVRTTAPMFIPDGRKESLRFETETILLQLNMHIDRLLVLDGRLAEAFASHSNFAVFHSLPVKGVATLSMICSAFGDRREDAPHWRQLAARWGVAPVTYASGKSRSVRRRKACDTHVLQALTDLAFTTTFSVSGCWATDFYKRKRSEGKDHHEVLRAVALRWVKILWRMWIDQVPYDESYHRRRKSTDAA
ncbi:MAG: IS110 family transposase [Lentisphaeria bacterium]|nr:IS110 family transposase [Lentisphaeria bacterium]